MGAAHLPDILLDMLTQQFETGFFSNMSPSDHIDQNSIPEGFSNFKSVIVESDRCAIYRELFHRGAHTIQYGTLFE